MNRKDKLKKLIERLHNNENFDSVKEDFKREFGSVQAHEIAQLEGELIQEGLPIEEIQNLCNVHASVFQGSVEEIHAEKKIDESIGHPLYIFRRENEGLEEYLKNNLENSFNNYKKDSSDENKKELLADLEGLRKLERHYSRKENLFFPYLEREGVTAPPKVMWGVDDEIRGLLKENINNLSNGEVKDEKIEEMIFEIREMIKKENEILTPLLVDKLKDEDWIVIAQSSPEIGFAFNGGIEGASPSDANEWLESKGNVEVDTLEEKNENDIVLPSGKMTKDELINMLNTVPSDLTFIGKDDLVRYFSEGKDPVFPRTRTIIGRDVRNCHPPKSLPIVNELIKDLKEGRKDEETRILRRGNKIFVIRYLAVRSIKGEFIGVLETTEEVSSIYNMITDEISKEKSYRGNNEIK